VRLRCARRCVSSPTAQSEITLDGMSAGATSAAASSAASSSAAVRSVAAATATSVPTVVAAAAPARSTATASAGSASRLSVRSSCTAPLASAPLSRCAGEWALSSSGACDGHAAACGQEVLLAGTATGLDAVPGSQWSSIDSAPPESLHVYVSLTGLSDCRLDGETYESPPMDRIPP
jgi:hypothetical protein